MVTQGGGVLFLVDDVPLYPSKRARASTGQHLDDFNSRRAGCEDRVLDGPASGAKRTKDRN